MFEVSSPPKSRVNEVPRRRQKTLPPHRPDRSRNTPPLRLNEEHADPCSWRWSDKHSTNSVDYNAPKLVVPLSRFRISPLNRHLSFAFSAPLVLSSWVCFSSSLSAHEGHDHDHPADVETGFVDAEPKADGVTGEGDFQFRYNAKLSELPKRIARGIKRAHGGFAKTPSGEIYFGLNGTGLIRLSADLKTKTLVSSSDSLLKGGLHNCTHVQRDGGFLVLPDNRNGRVLMVKTDGTEIKTLGRPKFLSDGKYAPTDVAAGGDQNLYVCDGYGASKTVLTIDLKTQDYGEPKFGGKAGPKQEPGKFSTNHGIAFDDQDDTLLIADRERQWLQKLSYDGDFIEGFQTDEANPCDIDFVEYNGDRLMIVGCLTSPELGVVKILKDGQVVSTLKPKKDLGLNQFKHVHNAAGVTVDGKLYVLIYGWNPGCYAVLEHITD